MDAKENRESMVSIGMWRQEYRWKLDKVMSHRSQIEGARRNRGMILGELVEKEYEKIVNNQE